MSLQSQLNKLSISYLPKIESLISKADSFEANQMECRTINAMNNAYKPVDKMDTGQLHVFQENLITIFKSLNLIS